MRRDHSPTTALKDFLPPMKTRFLALALGAVTLGACDDSFVPDYNNPNESDFTVFTSRDQLQSTATGLADGDRQLHDFQVLILGGEFDFVPALRSHCSAAAGSDYCRKPENNFVR